MSRAVPCYQKGRLPEARVPPQARASCRQQGRQASFHDMLNMMVDLPVHRRSAASSAASRMRCSAATTGRRWTRRPATPPTAPAPAPAPPPTMSPTRWAAVGQRLNTTMGHLVPLPPSAATPSMACMHCKLRFDSGWRCDKENWRLAWCTYHDCPAQGLECFVSKEADVLGCGDAGARGQGEHQVVLQPGGR
jgi:hypothetical protein